MIDPVRSALGLFGGLGAVTVTIQLLEFMLVRAVAGESVQDLDSFLRAANQPPMLAAKLVYSGLLSVLGGYLVAKVARYHPLMHGLFAAGLLATLGAASYATDEMAAVTPVAARVALVVVMSGAVVAGAAIRARAAALRANEEERGS